MKKRDELYHFFLLVSCFNYKFPIQTYLSLAARMSLQICRSVASSSVVFNKYGALPVTRVLQEARHIASFVAKTTNVSREL